MPRRCTICSHAERNEIDAALISGRPNRRIAAHFGVSETSVRRHGPHIPRALQRARALEAKNGASLLERAEILYEKATDLLHRAERSKNLNAAIGLIRESRSCIELLARMNGELIPYSEFEAGRRTLMQLIVRHVQDRTTLERIQEDIDQLAAGRRPEYLEAANE